MMNGRVPRKALLLSDSLFCLSLIANLYTWFGNSAGYVPNWLPLVLLVGATATSLLLRRTR